MGIVIACAESFRPGLLRDLVRYLRDKLRLPKEEILRLRLDEPEQIQSHFQIDGGERTSALDAVIPLIEQWTPEPLPSELRYRNSLAEHLRGNLQNLRIETEYRHLGTTTDIYIKQSDDSDVFLELKRNLRSKSECDRLVGQIESLQPSKHSIVIVLCGQTLPTLAARLAEKYKVRSSESSSSGAVKIVLKSHPRRFRSSKKQRRKHVETREKEFRTVLDFHRRRIQETRITNNLYAELRGLRDFFLQYGLADKSKMNRAFFDKWLTDPVVEMGWTPAGGWTPARVADLFGDLDRLTRKRIAGHKSAYSKIKKKLKDTQEISDMRAEHMKKAGLIVRHPRLK